MQKQRGVKKLEMLAELQIFGHVTAEFVFGGDECFWIDPDHKKRKRKKKKAK